MSRYEYDYTLPITLPADPETVFRALTDTQALQAWFAEHVEVEPQAGGAFRFWGRHTIDVPDRSQAKQRITRIEPPRMLAFSWPVLDRDSEVTWKVEPADDDDGNGSRITVSHSFSSLPDRVRAKELIDDLWRIHTGNLCFFLHGADDMFRPDFDDPEPEVKCEIVIDAPREKVFAALITPEYIKQWFPAPDPVVEPRVGGMYGFGFSYEMDGKTIEPPPMKILEFVENERLAFTWPDWRGDASVPDQRVTWVLEDAGGKTKLTLLHSGFTRTADVSDYPFGWQEFMRKIAEVAESI